MQARCETALPALIEDVLETWVGRWFRMSVLVSVVEGHRPGADPMSVRRAIWRVIDGGHIEIETRSIQGLTEVRCPDRAYLRVGIAA